MAAPCSGSGRTPMLSPTSGPARPHAEPSAGAALFVSVKCPGTRPWKVRGQVTRHASCHHTLLEVPTAWVVTVVMLADPTRATGRHPLKKCERCGGLVELQGLAAA